MTIATNKTNTTSQGANDHAGHHNLLADGVNENAADIAVLKEAPLNVLMPEWGMVGNATDESSLFLTALSAAYAAGGELYLPRPPGGSNYRIDSQILLPNENPGASYPNQRGVRIFGDGPHIRGATGTPVGGTIIDLRYNGTAKILTLGLGSLEIDHLTLRDEGTDTTPYIHTTGTTLKIHDVSAYGKSSKSGTSCDQDFIILGGATITQDGTENAPFQGYGTVIENNYMNAMRRFSYLRTYCNAVVVRDNWLGHACGSNLGTGACIEILGVVSNSCAGNVIMNNQFEVSYYPYTIKAEYALQNVFAFNGFYDQTATTTAYHRMEANAQFNMILGGMYSTSKPLLSETGASVGKNTVISSAQNERSSFPQGIKVGSNTFIDNGVAGGINRLTLTGSRLEQHSLAVANSIAPGAAGTYVKRTAIYDESANLLGYIHIFDV